MSDEETPISKSAEKDKDIQSDDDNDVDQAHCIFLSENMLSYTNKFMVLKY